MKKYFPIIISIIIVLMFSLSSSVVVHSAENDSLYKITTQSPEWKNFQTTEEMRRAVHIDEELIKNFSTEELLNATLDYPLVGDLLFFNSSEIAVKNVSEHCTALRLLLERDDCNSVIHSLYQQYCQAEILNSEDEDIVINKMILDILDDYISNKKPLQLASSTATVYTPKHTAVKVDICSEFSGSKISSLNKEAKKRIS